jgi:flagellar biosynthetic protein FlhB
MRNQFTLDRSAAFDDGMPVHAFYQAVGDGLLALAPVLVTLLIVTLIAGVAIGGPSFSVKALAFKPEKLNPINGFKRMFSARALLELFKALAKFLFIATVAAIVLWWLSDDLLGLSQQPLPRAMLHGAGIIALALLVLCIPLAVIAAVDIPFQLWDHTRQLKMTRQEVRDEHKETEGNPEVKGKVRQMQAEISRRRMLEAVPKADVVVTNPTHYSVALRYDPKRHAAPVVVAKGVNEVALNIRRIASEHGVPLLEAPPLARALHRACEIGDAIPKSLYMAVAQVLAWVFQLKEAHRKRADAPPKPDLGELS